MPTLQRLIPRISGRISAPRLISSLDNTQIQRMRMCLSVISFTAHGSCCLRAYSEAGVRQVIVACRVQWSTLSPCGSQEAKPVEGKGLECQTRVPLIPNFPQIGPTPSPYHSLTHKLFTYVLLRNNPDPNDSEPQLLTMVPDKQYTPVLAEPLSAGTEGAFPCLTSLYTLLVQVTKPTASPPPPPNSVLDTCGTLGSESL